MYPSSMRRGGTGQQKGPAPPSLAPPPSAFYTPNATVYTRAFRFTDLRRSAAGYRVSGQDSFTDDYARRWSTVCVKKLPLSMTVSELRACLNICGEPRRIRVVLPTTLDHSTRCYSLCFVEFSTPEEAERAIVMLPQIPLCPRLSASRSRQIIWSRCASDFDPNINKPCTFGVSARQHAILSTPLNSAGGDASVKAAVAVVIPMPRSLRGNATEYPTRQCSKDAVAASIEFADVSQETLVFTTLLRHCLAVSCATYSSTGLNAAFFASLRLVEELKIFAASAFPIKCAYPSSEKRHDPFPTLWRLELNTAHIGLYVQHDCTGDDNNAIAIAVESATMTHSFANAIQRGDYGYAAHRRIGSERCSVGSPLSATASPSPTTLSATRTAAVRLHGLDVGVLYRGVQLLIQQVVLLDRIMNRRRPRSYCPLSGWSNTSATTDSQSSTTTSRHDENVQLATDTIRKLLKAMHLLHRAMTPWLNLSSAAHPPSLSTEEVLSVTHLFHSSTPLGRGIWSHTHTLRSSPVSSPPTSPQWSRWLSAAATAVATIPQAAARSHSWWELRRLIHNCIPTAGPLRGKYQAAAILLEKLQRGVERFGTVPFHSS